MKKNDHYTRKVIVTNFKKNWRFINIKLLNSRKLRLYEVNQDEDLDPELEHTCQNFHIVQLHSNSPLFP